MLLSSSASAIDVRTSAAFRQQKFEAWGTSLAWSGNALGNWTNTQAHAEVMDLLFEGPNHLGLNYARYNIGGGQNPLLAGNLRPGAAVPGWAPLAPTSVTNVNTWNWNWNADPGQRNSLNAAIARGVNRVDAVSYSAPYWMTNSFDAAGAVGGGDNLQTSLYDEYAHYQTEVIKHFRDERGIEFGTFAPMNEPDASWWQAGGGQEGMHVSPSFNQRLLLETVGQALQAKGLATGVSANDAFSANSTVNAFNQYDATTLSYIKQINTHVYGGSSSNSTASMQAVRNLAKTRNIPLYQSEYGNNSNSGIAGGIDLANRITVDINVMGVNGWTFWQAVEPLSLSGAGWGLMWAGYDSNSSGYVVRPQYHVMRQFTSFIRPGADILKVNDDETVAAYNSGSDSTVLVFTNDETTADANVYSLLDKPVAYTRLIRTDGAGNCVSLGPASVAGNQLTVNSPGTSVTTAVIYHRPNLLHNAGFAASAGWQSAGSVSHSPSAGNASDGSGGMILHSKSVANSGAVWQEGVGDADVDLTGKAYELSLDMMQQNNSLQFGADVRIGLEFHGADGQTLTHAAGGDYEEQLKPFTQDSSYRVVRTAVAQAPAGTRFVRPVVRFDNVAAGATGLVYLDNAYLQETRYVPRAKAWDVDDDGDWSGDNWQSDALVENNSAAYFGPHITARRTVTLETNAVSTGITFDSEYGYEIAGDATLTIGSAEDIAKVDVRSGSHAIFAPVELSGPTQVQVVGSSRIFVESSFNLHGHRLEKTGPGRLHLTSGFEMNGGTLAIGASRSPGIILGNDATLDGVLEVSLAAGQQANWGSVYTLANLASANQAFNGIELPELSQPWLDWKLQYHPTYLTAEVINRADFNRDGRMDADDLARWRGDFGVDAASDGDGDGFSDGYDFLIWQRALGTVLETNTLSLLVDPATGDARIENLSHDAFTIDAYTISSESNSLHRSWRSLDDQNFAGWIEALPTSGRLSELNPASELLLSPGATVDLPGLFNVASDSPDLGFQFRDADLGTMSGRVVFTPFAQGIALAARVPEPAVLGLLPAASLFWKRLRRRLRLQKALPQSLPELPRLHSGRLS
jgi:hypothetical protein